MTAPTEEERDDKADHLGVAFWIGLAVGALVMAYGLKGLLGAASTTQPRNLFTFFIGAGVVHDALFAPLVVVVGWLTARFVPKVARVPVWIALSYSVVLIAFAWPLVRRYGARSTIPSALPLDYGRNLVVSLVVIWVVAIAAAAVLVVRDRRAAPAGEPR